MNTIRGSIFVNEPYGEVFRLRALLVKNFIKIAKDLSCRPCYKKFRLPQCSYDRKCLKEITVDEVFNGAKRLLCS